MKIEKPPRFAGSQFVSFNVPVLDDALQFFRTRVARGSQPPRAGLQTSIWRNFDQGQFAGKLNASVYYHCFHTVK
jgi:hypothetical protein